MKLTLSPLGSLQNETTAIQVLNDNFAAVSEFVEGLLSRDGESPNQMAAHIDFNSFRGLNVGAPIAGSDIARLSDITNVLTLGGETLIPSLEDNEDKVLSNDGEVLVWVEPADIPGLGDMKKSDNLSGLSSYTTARTNMGLGTAATFNISTTGNNVPVLSGLNAWTGNQTFAGSSTFSGAVELTATSNHRLTGAPSALTTDSIGYRGAPVTVVDANYTFVLGDAGQTVGHTSVTAHAWTIPPSTHPVGSFILFFNDGTGAVTLTRGSGVTLTKAGSGTNANVTVNQYGFGQLFHKSTNVWVASGAGIV